MLHALGCFMLVGVHMGRKPLPCRRLSVQFHHAGGIADDDAAQPERRCMDGKWNHGLCYPRELPFEIESALETNVRAKRTRSSRRHDRVGDHVRSSTSPGQTACCWRFA